MSLTLYHYVHCPFCIRVRMTLGYLNVPYTSEILPYDDESTPIKLTGKKMLPILEFGENQAMNESLDIMLYLDRDNKLAFKETISSNSFKEFETYLNHLGSPIHSLAMPYFIWTPEFNESSRAYFQKKKEEKRGSFNDLVKNQKTFIDMLESEWPKLEQELRPFYKSENFTVYDILLASHLWGLYLVPEFQFSLKIHTYLQTVKAKCHFNYHQHFWTWPAK